MKVLFQSYNTCCQNPNGGVQIRMRKIRDLLIRRGIQVDFFNQFETNLSNYDVLHVFMLSTENMKLMKVAKAKGLKVVLSSIVNINASWKERFLLNLYKLPIPTIEKLYIETARLCDVIIAETQQEALYIHKYYKVSEFKIVVIPNGVNDLPKCDDEEIFKLFNGERFEYVLQVGRFDSNKNQLVSIKALKSTNKHLVFVGGPDNTRKNYYEKCVDEAKNCRNIHFLGWLPANSSILSSAYRNAHALILPSYQETFGLVALEAAMAGCHVCLSKSLPILDFGVFDRNLTFSPDRPHQLADVVDMVMKLPKNDSVMKSAKAVFSWDKVVESHIRLYSTK